MADEHAQEQQGSHRGCCEGSHVMTWPSETLRHLARLISHCDSSSAGLTQRTPMLKRRMVW